MRGLRAAIVRGLRTAMKSGPRLPQLEKALAQKRRPNTAINKLKNLKKKEKHAFKKKKKLIRVMCISKAKYKSGGENLFRLRIYSL